MEFITDEQIAELGIDKEVIEKIKPLYESHIATEKKAWDGVATTNAEKIIDGAIASTVKKFNIDLPREQGEKNADYLARLNEKVVETEKGNIAKLEADYKSKLKEVGNGDATAKELAETKQKLDEALQKYAEFDTIKERADKYEPLQNEYLTLKETVTFQSVKPSFPDTVNPYEAKAKWDEFVSSVKEKWNIEYVDNVAIAIDKENHHKQVKLSELVTADKALTDLLAGRQQTGPGARGKGFKEVAGVPFLIPEGATSADISKAINTQLDKDGILLTSKERPKKFAEYLAKVNESKK